jgi:hypothetical protein
VVECAKYDLRWKVALGLEIEEVPMQKSALQEFDAKLVLHEMEEPILNKSITEGRRAGYLHNGKIRVVLDTTPILGKERCRTPTICWEKGSRLWEGGGRWKKKRLRGGCRGRD